MQAGPVTNTARNLGEKCIKVAEDRLHLFAEYAIDRARAACCAATPPCTCGRKRISCSRILAEHPGVLIQKDQIIERIWAGRAVGDDSLVQCLGDVRHALGEGGMRRIVTVRGRGYIFDPDPASLTVPPVRIAPSVDLVDSETPLVRESVPSPPRSRWAMTAGLLFAGVLAAAGTGYSVLDNPPLAAPDHPVHRRPAICQ